MSSLHELYTSMQASSPPVLKVVVSSAMGTGKPNSPPDSFSPFEQSPCNIAMNSLEFVVYTDWPWTSHDPPASASQAQNYRCVTPYSGFSVKQTHTEHSPDELGTSFMKLWNPRKGALPGGPHSSQRCTGSGAKAQVNSKMACPLWYTVKVAQREKWFIKNRIQTLSLVYT